MLIPETVVLALVPALSVAVPVADWAAPAALRVIGLVQLAIPERTSEQRKLAVTSLLFQPLALAAGLRLPLIAGPVLSMLIPETVALALLPALSVAVAVARGVAPSALRVTSGGQLSIPERTSAQGKCAVTEPPSQPPAAGAEVAPALPALSVAVLVADWAAPAALRVIGLVQLAIPERTSEQRKLAVTSLLFQPLALAAGLRLPLIAGPVLSMLIPETVALALLPALSV